MVQVLFVIATIILSALGAMLAVKVMRMWREYKLIKDLYKRIDRVYEEAHERISELSYADRVEAIDRLSKLTHKVTEQINTDISMPEINKMILEIESIGH